MEEKKKQKPKNNKKTPHSWFVSLRLIL